MMETAMNTQFWREIVLESDCLRGKEERGKNCNKMDMKRMSLEVGRWMELARIVLNGRLWCQQ
jgi:hypothetical protein